MEINTYQNPYFYDFNDHTWGWLVKITLVFVGLISACGTGCWIWHCPQPHCTWSWSEALFPWGWGGCCVLNWLGIPLHFKVCRLWLSEKVNLSPQPHAYGFSPVCLLICLFKEFWKTYPCRLFNDEIKHRIGIWWCLTGKLIDFERHVTAPEIWLVLTVVVGPIA